MLFGSLERYRYTVSPLTEVICQLRFPQILSITAHAPADFQETVRGDFPRYSVADERPAPKLVTPPGGGEPRVEQQPTIKNHAFVSADGLWKLNLTQSFIAISTHAYTTWEDFAARLDKPLASFIECYRPAFFERVGLRYVNAFHRSAVGLDGTPWRELINTPFLGILSAGDVDDAAAARATSDSELSLADGTHLKLHTGPGLVRRAGAKENDPEPRFIIDADFSASGTIPLVECAQKLETMHSWSTRLIRAALTEKLHDALGPEIL